MNRRFFCMSTIAALSGRLRSFGQSQPDLARLADSGGFQVFHRAVSSFREGARSGARVSEAPGDGVAYLKGAGFANGTIEVDLRGKDVQQHSFLGVAFHGVDGTTYESVYFRPFNFRAADPARRVRAVQYVSHPTYTWYKLREDHPGQYEQAVTPVPDPNGWFHARVVLAGPRVSVFVDDAKEPSLAVTRLSERGNGLIGLWVGNTSGGDFANLRVTPA